MKRVLVALLLFAACTSGSSPAIDQVTGLTIIAIKADPPDQLMVQDGGFFALLPDGGAGAGPTLSGLAPVNLSTLIADPTGDGRGIQVVFATCAQLDGTTHQCLPTSTDYTVIGSGGYFPDAGPAIVATTTFVPSQQLLGDALALDPLHGFSYLPLPVQVTVNAGDDQVVGVKTLTFSQPITVDVGELGGLPDAGLAVLQPPDANPVMPPITLDGTPWLPDGGSPSIQSGETVEPQPQTSELPYFVPEFDGGLIPFTDFWGYAFYCTAGSFSSPRSGGGPRPGFSVSIGRHQDAGSNSTNDAGEVVPGTSVEWTADGGTPGQLVFYWIVVLDGRGGADFTQLTAQFQPF